MTSWVIRWLSIAAGVTAVAVVLATAYQAAAGPVDTNPPGESVDQGQVGDPAAPSAEVDDPDPNDLDPNDLDPDDPEVQDPEIQDPEVDDSDPDDPDPGVAGPAGPRGPAGSSVDDADPDDPDPNDPEIQDPETQDPEIDDPDPGGLTCPPGFTAGDLVLNAPGGQITLHTCIAE